MQDNLKKYIKENLKNPDLGKKIDLSHQEVSIADYSWLATILQKSSYIEEILLPHLLEKEAEIIIPFIHKITSRTSTITKIENNLSQYSLSAANEVLYQQINSHLKRNKQRIFAIHGGGNIGLGLMADVLGSSHYQYQVIATSNNIFISNLINSRNKLWLQHSVEDISDISCVNNVTMIPRTSVQVINLYKQANLAAICVTPEVLSLIVNDIAT